LPFLKSVVLFERSFVFFIQTKKRKENMKNTWVQNFRSHLGLSDHDVLPERLSEEEKGVAIRLLSETAPSAMNQISRFASDAGNGEREERGVDRNSQLDMVTCEEGVSLLNKVYHNCTHQMVSFVREGGKLVFWSPSAVTARNKKTPCGVWKSPIKPRPIRYGRRNGTVVFG
jgi:hypothetical protein